MNIEDAIVPNHFQRTIAKKRSHETNHSFTMKCNTMSVTRSKLCVIANTATVVDHAPNCISLASGLCQNGRRSYF